MFGEISLLAWMGSAIVFAIGGGAGFFIARQIKDKRTLELEQRLQATQNKLTEYQDDVNRHFLKSSLLFSKLTDNYREVYEHLATGAQKLCNEKPVITALDLPDTKILSAASPKQSENIGEKKSATDTAAASVSAAETPVSEQTAPEQAATEQHATEQQPEDEHLGVESSAAHQGIFENETTAEESEKVSNAGSEMEDKETMTPEQVAADQTEDQTKNKTENVTPTISDEELKKLEAIEKEKEESDDVHLGAESTPGVELDHHKTHPAIH